MTTELQRSGLINEIVTEIKKRIMSGQYAHDGHLPSQDALATSLGVSRPSLREALNQLSLLGLVDVQHGVGTFIKKPKPTDFLFNFSSLVILDSNSADELLQARLIIEPAVVALAAEKSGAIVCARLSPKPAPVFVQLAPPFIVSQIRPSLVPAQMSPFSMDDSAIP